MVAACQSLVGTDDKHLTASPAPGTTSSSPSTTSSADAGPPPGARPAGRPPGDPAAGGGQTIAFGVRRFHLGTVDPTMATPDGNGVADDAYWRKLGFDLDGLNTTKQAISAGDSGCAIDRTTGVEDGDDGRDNALGSGLLRYAASIDPPNAQGNTEQGSYHDIQLGYRTMILELLDVGDGPDDPFVPGRVYLAADQTGVSTPKWDGTDVRPVSDASVTAAGAALTTFPGGYIRDNVWISGEETALGGTLYLPFSPGYHPTIIYLPLKAGWITANLSADRKTGKLAVSLASPIDDIRKQTDCVALLARGCDDSSGSGYSSLRGFALMQVQPDVSLSAIDHPDPAKTCDGISFGAGGELIQVKLGPVVKEVLASCPQAVCAH
jgi:hypothetical protein